MARITTVQGVESTVGERPSGAMAKSIPLLDELCLTFLQHSPFAALGVQTSDGEQHTVTAGGEPGCLHPHSVTELGLPVDVADLRARGVRDGDPAGLCALVPGYGETLRVNGRVVLTDDGARLDVSEAFLHCAKCMLRSKLWGDHEPSTLEPHTADGALGKPGVPEFLERSTFAFLTSSDETGTDVSPKGDPAGFVTIVGEHLVAIPDRPGNRRTDTFHNLMSHDRIGVLALVPGDDRVLRLRGSAELVDDPDLLAALEAGGHTPAVALRIDVDAAELAHDERLRAARLWDPARRVDPKTLPRAAHVWKTHVQLDADSAAAKALKLVPERLMDAGLQRDYESNLY